MHHTISLAQHPRTAQQSIPHPPPPAQSGNINHSLVKHIRTRSFHTPKGGCSSQLLPLLLLLLLLLRICSRPPTVSHRLHVSRRPSIGTDPQPQRNARLRGQAGYWDWMRIWPHHGRSKPRGLLRRERRRGKLNLLLLLLLLWVL